LLIRAQLQHEIIVLTRGAKVITPLVPFTVGARCTIHRTVNCIEIKSKSNSRDFAAERKARPAARPYVRHLQEHYTAPTTSGLPAGRNVTRSGLRRPAISRPITPKPLTPQDRQYLRALREAEMSLWMGIQKTAEQECLPQPTPSLGKLFTKLSTGHQRRELAMLLILATAASVAVAVSFIQSGSFLQRWAEFVANVQSF
jgi:hypothetical protein